MVFCQIRLEDMAEKDATEKSDAAREAFLAELALDSKKSLKGGLDNLKHAQDRTKDKKRHKDNRKNKDSKVLISYSVPCFFFSVTCDKKGILKNIEMDLIFDFV